MTNEEALIEFAQLIQDYFLWAVTNPEEAALLSAVPSGALQLPPQPQPTGKHKPVPTEHSDLLGFSRWLARGRK